MTYYFIIFLFLLIKTFHFAIIKKIVTKTKLNIIDTGSISAMTLHNHPKLVSQAIKEHRPIQINKIMMILNNLFLFDKHSNKSDFSLTNFDDKKIIEIQIMIIWVITRTSNSNKNKK
ncbi:MAG: hypothetical protein KFW07_00670 [Mycoplasmataceae bacterium]|nr:hypothetical protein [Mycoplasmataceae bacterium]